MNETPDEKAESGPATEESPPRLQASVTRIREAMADRQDAVEDLREKERVLLIALQRELSALAEDVSKSDDWILLSLSQGEKPRFWVDLTSHVAIGRDQRTYRFLRDTRLGRIVVSETEDVRTAAQAVADYLAERIVERERAIDGEWLAAVQTRYKSEDGRRAEEVSEKKRRETAAPSRSAYLGWYGFGIVSGLVLMFLLWAYSDPTVLETLQSMFRG